VADGVNGFLVPARDPLAIADAVVRLTESPDLRRRLGERSRERAVTQFAFSVVAERTELVYRELLAAKRIA
jgi:glycosyltransferase involved in cell wall biosynthesis